MDTGHDLEAERVGAAFGGFLSCIDLVDKVVPALERGIALRARALPPAIRRDQYGWIATEDAPGCHCTKPRTRTARSLRDAGAAAAHVRSVRHLAHVYGADEVQLDRLMDLVAQQNPLFERIPAHPEAASLVVEEYGLTELWDAGISPETVVQVHHQLWPDQGAVPARLYLSFGTYVEAAVWAPWRGHGLPMLDIEQLLESEYQVEDVVRLAQATSRTPRQIGTLLASWSRAGCSLGDDELRTILGLDQTLWSVPSRQAVDRVQAEVFLSRATRSEVGLVLAVARSPIQAVRAIRAGANDPISTYRYLSKKGLM